MNNYNVKNIISKFWPMNISARVIYYHSIGNIDDNSQPIVEFSKQINWLLENEYKIVNLSDFIDRVYKNGNFNKKIVSITFDDGYEDNYLNVFKILKKYKVPATIFIISGILGKNTSYLPASYRLYKNRKMLNHKQIKEMSANGIEIGSHTLHHINVAEILEYNYNDCYKELLYSKNILEKIINNKVSLFSYPNGQKGTFNKQTQSILKIIGYKAATTTMCKKTFWEKSSIYEIPRIEIKSNDDLSIFKNKIMGKYDYLSYYYRIFDLSKKW